MSIKVSIPSTTNRKHDSRHHEDTVDWGGGFYHIVNKSYFQTAASMSFGNPSSGKSRIAFPKGNLSSYFQKERWIMKLCRGMIAHSVLSR